MFESLLGCRKYFYFFAVGLAILFMVCTVLLPVGINSHYVEFFSDISGESSSSLSLYFEPEIPSWGEFLGSILWDCIFKNTTIKC